jgi:AcrR family transcriptional regulator
MDKARNSDSWLEEGYKLFATEGLEGIQIERLARILQLNKSGFYHYFGDLDGFFIELIALHQKNAHEFMHELRGINTIDPDYFQLVARYKDHVMVQMQFLRNGHNKSFCSVAESIDRKESIILRDLWSEYLGIQDNPDLAVRYFAMVRDMCYARISYRDLNSEFVGALIGEAREVMRQIAEGNLALEEDKSLA